MSVNRVILIGNVGQDPRVKYFDTGSAVATFPLATTDRGYTLANGTQIPERTEWHNIVASNRLAEIVDKYVHKGDKLGNSNNRLPASRNKRSSRRHNPHKIIRQMICRSR